MAQLHPDSPGPRIQPIEIPGRPRPVDLIRRSPDLCTLSVGRSPESDVPLDPDAFPSVSSEHARFELRDRDLFVVDLESMNGVLVNGEPIPGEARIEVGDQVRLGPAGPRFLVVAARGLDDTVFVQRESLGRAAAERSHRRTRRLALALSALTLGVVAIVYVLLSEGAQREQDETQEQLAAALAQIAALEERAEESAATVAAETLAREQRFEELERQASLLERDLDAQVAEEARLVARIAELESGQASRDVVERVEEELAETRRDLRAAREELEDTRDKVEMLDPVNLEQGRLSGVAAVRRTIVLVENTTRVVDRDTGAPMHVSFLRGAPEANFEGRGEEFVIESSGSGFCVDAAGHIITNAHVVEPPNERTLRALASEANLEIEQSLAVVFSGTDDRIEAELVGRAVSGEDLALLAIAPFEDMPSLPDFSTDSPAPPPGSDIYLFGFPLGNIAVQEGRTVIASTFRGILSRNVGGQMQVDAGVHPGNSGGPITDASGRVVGVVVSVQSLPDRTAVYTIGYGIPIAAAAEIWPPGASLQDAEGDE